MATGSKVTVSLVTVPVAAPAAVAASFIVAGDVYQIKTLGTSNFTQYGAAKNLVGITFTASMSDSGDTTTGTVTPLSATQGGYQGQLEFVSLYAEPFNYHGGPSGPWNTAADQPFSSGGPDLQASYTNIQGSGGPLGGNAVAGDAGVICTVKVHDNYSLDHTLDSYDVNFSYGSTAIPAMTTTLAAFAAEALFAVDAVITANLTGAPVGSMVGGGGPYALPTGPVAPLVI